MYLLKSLRNVLLIVFVTHGAFFLFIQNLYAQKENLNVLHKWIEWSNSENMLIRHLNQQAFTYLDNRDTEIARLNTKADWAKRQQEIKDKLMEIVGPFPEKAPLNAKVTGIVEKDGFRVENVIYESMPDLYVTAALLIPDEIRENRPAIIHVSGHGFAAFRSTGNQNYIYNLARKGFIVFAIDPLGQGERIQYWNDEEKESKFGSPTGEHSYFGNHCCPGKYKKIKRRSRN